MNIEAWTQPRIKALVDPTELESTVVGRFKTRKVILLSTAHVVLPLPFIIGEVLVINHLSLENLENLLLYA